jgi:ribonuclease P protein component
MLILRSLVYASHPRAKACAIVLWLVLSGNLCLSAPTNQRSESAHARTASLPAPPPQADVAYFLLDAAKDAPPSPFLRPSSMAARLPRHSFATLRSLPRAHAEHLTLTYSTNHHPYGMAVVVSKKVAKTASGRALLKRRLRALLQPYATKSVVVVLHAKAGAPTLSFKDLKAEVDSLCSKLS